VFAPMARTETIRLVVALANGRGWPLFQLDVKSAFLNVPLEEEVFVTQPPGFELQYSPGKVYKLRKALYGLKQAPRTWNKVMDLFMQKQQFSKCLVEHGVYIKHTNGGSMVIMCIYVDDLLITRNNNAKIEGFKQTLMAKFKIIDLGRLKYFLGMEFIEDSRGMILHQHKYASEILKKFNMINSNPAATPAKMRVRNGECNVESEEVDITLYKQMVGSLRYLCNNKPDISFVVGWISRFMNQPRKVHLIAVKRVLRYIKGTVGHGILFPKGIQNQEELCGWKIQTSVEIVKIGRALVGIFSNF